ncbi:MULTISPECIES: hypothetical protein [unclassified Lentimonas]|nr:MULTISPECIES: hypothetical protein [unclassified Lentimonas]CAA6695671.1 Unannotated [Lentimonas sp. CC10]CAA6679371.1 Unannotated [Lentimonas sp. CC4]CAA6687350.1 Unannotated [Lentimonas sp. CC6]CAA6693092.1 Unannotated [Lentimonas sp. CC19]CAA7071524.1 Unannotated [Lentimonas sp. CC11]
MIRLLLLSTGLVSCAFLALWIRSKETRDLAELPRLHRLADPIAGSEDHLPALPEFSEAPVLDGGEGRADVVSFDGLSSKALAIRAEQDIGAALNWLSEDADASVFETAYPIIMHELVRQRPLQAAQMIPELQSGFLRDSLVTSISRQWVQVDSDAALAWASALEDASLRGHAQRSVLLAVCEASYEDAMGHVLALSVEQDRLDLLSTVFAHEIQSQRLRTQSSSRLLQLAESSIEQISEAPLRGRARFEAAQLLIATHPQVAFALVERAEASDSREGLLLTAFRSLSELDPDLANHMLNESTLSDSMKDQLRSASGPVLVEMVIPKRP